MKFLPIKKRLEDNQEFLVDALYRSTVESLVGFYKRVGFVEPWIGYYVEEGGELIGSAGYKGPPVNGTVEIAYGTNDRYRQQGFGTKICKLLVNLALTTDPSVRITARTFSGSGYSAKILEKNKFVCLGTVNDPEDGEVWEWLFANDAML